MKKVLISMTILFMNSLNVFSQVVDSLSQIQLEEVVVSSTRVSNNASTVFSNLNEEQIKKGNAGKSIPFVLQTLPSVVSYSENGTGLGNTYFRIRGTDASRINVTLNGMPLNNPESQDVFWVNLPELSNSLKSIQVQRGVGSSTNGTASFGGSISLETATSKSESYASASTAIGSYDSFVSSISAGSGLMKNRLSIDGRYSRASGDGYIRNGKVNHKSTYLTLAHLSDKQLVRFVYLNGIQHTGITWEGASPEKLAQDRRYNPSGEYNDDAGNVHYYDNETDNYYSHIVQAIYTRYLNQSLTLTGSASYNNGHGYYENYKANQKLQDKFGLQSQMINGITHHRSDVVRKKMLANGLVTGIASLAYKKNHLTLIGGAMYSFFYGSHYGHLKWVKFNQNIPENYEWYRDESTKRDMNISLKANYILLERINIHAELQNRNVDYRMTGKDDDMADITNNYYYSFLNPKIGLSFNIDAKNNIYASFGISNREPQRADLKEYKKSDKDIKSERLYDFEAGYRYVSDNFSVENNLYLMNYRNQLIPTGKLSSSGYKLQENVPESYRVGAEFSIAYNPLPWSRIMLNGTLSRGIIKNYTAYYKTYDNQTDWNQQSEQISEFFKSTDISFSPKAIASGILTINPYKTLDLSFVNKYVGKMYYDNTSDKENQLAEYFVADLVLGYTFKTKKQGEIEIQLYVNNIFNKDYIANAWVDTYQFTDGSKKVYKGLFPQAPRNIMVRASVKF